MPSENYLVTFTTAANLAGADALKASMLGLNATTVLLAAGLFAVFEVGKAGVENFKKQEEAVNLLNQAYATQGQTYDANRVALEAFIRTNAAYIANQYDVMAAMAALIRAGNSQEDALRALNIALDMAAVKHEDVSVEAILLEKALQGNVKALKEVGISTEYAAIQNNKLLTTEQKHLAILALIEAKYKDGRLVVDDYTGSQNKLNIAWQNFTGQAGGPIIGTLTEINKALETGVELLDLYGQLVAKLAAIGPFGGHFLSSSGPTTPGATVGGHGRATPTGAGAPQPIVIHNKLVLGGRELDLVANTIVNNARYRPGL